MLFNILKFIYYPLFKFNLKNVFILVNYAIKINAINVWVPIDLILLPVNVKSDSIKMGRLLIVCVNKITLKKIKNNLNIIIFSLFRMPSQLLGL